MEQSDSFDLLVGNSSYDHAEVSSGRVRAAAASEARLTVCARTTAMHSFHVVATQLGHVNFTVQVNWHLLTHTHTRTHARTHARTHTHTLTHSHAHTRTHARTHAHTHTHARACALEDERSPERDLLAPTD